MRLQGLFTGELSWRELDAYVQFLPQESPLVTELRNSTPSHELAAVTEYGSWSQESMLLAEVIDSLRWLQWSKTKSAEKGGKPPDPYPRPGVEQRRKPQASITPEVINMFEYLRAHNGAAPTG